MVPVRERDLEMTIYRHDYLVTIRDALSLRSSFHRANVRARGNLANSIVRDLETAGLVRFVRCADCDLEFVPTTTTTRFCTANCRVRNHRKEATR